MSSGRLIDLASEPQKCRLGYEEYDGSRYCFEHGDFLMAGKQGAYCPTWRAQFASRLPMVADESWRP